MAYSKLTRQRPTKTAQASKVLKIKEENCLGVFPCLFIALLFPELDFMSHIKTCDQKRRKIGKYLLSQEFPENFPKSRNTVKKHRETP